MLGLIDGSDPLFGVFSGFGSSPPPVGLLSPGGLSALSIDGAVPWLRSVMTGRVVRPFGLYSTAGARSSPVSLGWGFESHPRRRENLSCPSGSLLHELNKLTISHFFAE